MNSESKINVHYSSLVGLKAELLRKQTEVETVKARLGNEKSFNKSNIKSKISSKKDKKKFEEEKASDIEDIESMKVLKKSKLMLQAKSRLYDNLSKTYINMSPHFLVDFEQKSISLDNFEKIDEKNQNNSVYETDNEFVEYTDCFGRTRKCLFEDLPKMKEKDKVLRKRVTEKEQDEIQEKNFYIEDRMPEKEPEIEMMRRKWEEQTQNLVNKVDIHYQDILFDEARSHGVGYYAFSQDEEERSKQQENLSKLRQETEKMQKENKQIREAKDKMQENRMKVAWLRQRIRSGLPIEDENFNYSTSLTNHKNDNRKEECVINNDEKEIKGITNDLEILDNSKLSHKNLKDIENRIQTFEKVLGKTNEWYIMSQEEWVHKKRKERTQEFGPTYKNFKHDVFLDLPDSANKSSLQKESINSNNFLYTNDLILDQLIQPLDSNSSISLTETLNSPSTTDSSVHPNVDIATTIEAGLKYLRQQFEHKSKK